MGRVLSNNTTLQYAIELTETDPNLIGVLPGEDGQPGLPTWYELEPNAIGTIGAEISTVARNPISKNRQRRKGTIVDLDSSADFEQDLTISAFEDFVEGFVFSKFIGAGNYPATAVTAPNTYVATGSPVLVANTLVYGVGFTNAANNGLKICVAGGAPGSVVVLETLITETPPASAKVEVAGFRTATGDLSVDVTTNPGQILIDSAAGIFTSAGLGIEPGCEVWFGGEESTNQFFEPQNRGFLRVLEVTASQLVCDKPKVPWVDEAGATQSVDIYVGRFLRNVAVDDADFLERSFQFEVGYDNLGATGNTEYEYSKGNYCNTVAFGLPLTDKSTFNPTFIGTDTLSPQGNRKPNADTPIRPIKNTAFNTTQDCARLRITDIDGTGITTDFKSLTLTLNNNVSPEKVLCVLGARFMNYGNFEVDLETQVLFTSSAVVSAIRENTTVGLDFSLRNDNGGIFVDVPSMTLGGGGKDFPVNESVLVNLTGQAFIDDVLRYSIGITEFTYLPTIDEPTVFADKNERNSRKDTSQENTVVAESPILAEEN